MTDVRGCCQLRRDRLYEVVSNLDLELIDLALNEAGYSVGGDCEAHYRGKCKRITGPSTEEWDHVKNGHGFASVSLRARAIDDSWREPIAASGDVAPISPIVACTRVGKSARRIRNRLAFGGC
jgi:hypothetical protein